MDATVRFELSDDDWDHIAMRIDCEGDHVVWFGPRTRDGYATGWIGGETRLVGRAILADKLGRKLRPEMQACHIVGCRFRNCIAPEHLYEGTREQNMADKVLDGTNIGPRGEKNGAAKLTEAQVIAIRADDRKLHEIAAEYGIDQTVVSKIKHRKRWQHVPEKSLTPS